MILAGDIGGTKTRLAAFEERDAQLVALVEEDYPSSKYSTLEEIIRLFIDSHKLKIQAACLGFAGPVRQGQAVATNLPWAISVAELAKCLQTADVWIINDLEANAYGIDLLLPQDFYIINTGKADPQGNAGLISAGTGLGEAGLVYDGKKLKPFATEGGHCDFAAKSALEVELFNYLQVRYGTVSWERVVSGTGLFNIYSFLRDTSRGEDPDWLTAEILQKDSAACISQAALKGMSNLCDMALNMFVTFYGAEAGNLALKLMATGGIYIGGGIAPKILERLKTPLFFQSFASKGRLEKVLKDIPVRVILNDKTALIGAAHYTQLKRTDFNSLASPPSPLGLKSSKNARSSIASRT